MVIRCQQHLRSTNGLRSSRDQGDERHVATKHEAAEPILESRYRAAVGTHLMKVAIRRTQTHSDALISGNQSSSAAIRAHQRTRCVPVATPPMMAAVGWAAWST